MDWLKAIGNSIIFIESNLLEDITVDDIARNVNISTYYFQKGFTMMCGYSVSEYIRNRRLTLAGEELLANDEKVLDIALKYYYNSVDSFTKAFTRFHGNTPISVKKGEGTIKTFSPLKISVVLEGGNLMDYKIESKESFKIIAVKKSFSYDTSMKLIPKFWNEHYASGNDKVICGMFGICIDSQESLPGMFEYLIADIYTNQEIPKGFSVETIPALDWAIFPCRGAMPEALQSKTKQIFSEWLPSSTEYEISSGYSIEMYDDKRKYPNGTKDKNYYSEIWIPVKKK